MDRKKSLLNVTVSMISRLILLIAALIVRRLLIHYIGNDVNGLNALYTSIIGILAIAELGIGSAIVYSMYKPVADGDQETLLLKNPSGPQKSSCYLLVGVPYFPVVRWHE